MFNKTLILLCILCLTSFMAYTQNQNSDKAEPHRYGGWYCPDNLNGFPAVDISDWNNVPVVNGRMASKEETHNGTSLIYVDMEKYPDAKPLDISMPKLASFYNNYSKRDELIIVIQAINVDNDSIVGFRYLNGGNGSARLNEVRFLTENEIAMIPSSRFVSYQIEIQATQDEIWDILTNPKNAKNLRETFDKENKLKSNWRDYSNVNYYYTKKGNMTSSYTDKLFGNFYVQNDYSHYNEKFLLLENEESGITVLKIVCGPFGNEFNSQESILIEWAKKVKVLSEEK